MAKVELKSARTSEKDPAKAAEELCRGLAGVSPKLVTFFASSDRDPVAFNRALRERLPKGTRVVGASTGGEIDNGGIYAGSVVASALCGDLEVGIGLGRSLTDDAVAAGARALAAAAADLDVRPQDLDPKKYVGLVIDDGFRYKKEELLLGVLDKCPSLILVGGGAANADLASPESVGWVHADGEAATDAVLVVLIKTDANWGALRSHWYTPTGQTVRITKVDETCTRALEIDGQPAAKRYAELIGVSIDDLEFGKPNGFSRRPTALKVGREHFIRAPWKPLPDGSILFVNLLDEGAELELMDLGDPSELTRKFFKEDLPRQVPNPTAALLFHCGGRVMFAHALGQAQELSASFANAPPSAGFNVHFEIYSGFQINTTLTVLAFGQNDA
ncbi:MAG: FIST C-terminal domain-containing protein [Labilithrix sp.]|nr:FIST C-terminal domain-containing protein [Labilithrix sp.]